MILRGWHAANRYATALSERARDAQRAADSHEDRDDPLQQVASLPFTLAYAAYLWAVVL